MFKLKFAQNSIRVHAKAFKCACCRNCFCSYLYSSFSIEVVKKLVNQADVNIDKNVQNLEITKIISKDKDTLNFFICNSFKSYQLPLNFTSLDGLLYLINVPQNSKGQCKS